jgi:hypothetical protein
MAAIDRLPLGERRLILGAGVTGADAPVVRCAEGRLEARGAVTGAVVEAAVDPV